jgi:hypothetical protein
VRNSRSPVLTSPGWVQAMLCGPPSRVPPGYAASQQPGPARQGLAELIARAARPGQVVLPSAAPQVLQRVPLSWNAAGGALLPVLVPVKPMVTDADGAMVWL